MEAYPTRMTLKDDICDMYLAVQEKDIQYLPAGNK